MKKAFQKVLNVLLLVWRYIRRYVCNSVLQRKHSVYRNYKSEYQCEEVLYDPESDCLLESPGAEEVEPGTGTTETGRSDESDEEDSDRTTEG